MFVTLDEAKIYLRVDGEEENTLIIDFIKASENICEDVLRYPLSDFETVPESIRQAILYSVGQFYELRETLDMKNLTEMIKILLFAYRKESW